MESNIIRLEGEISMEDYIRDYRDVEKFMGCCRVCGSFSKRWHCSPIAPEFEIDFSRYEHVRVVGYKIIPAHSDSPADSAADTHDKAVKIAQGLLVAPAKRLGAELLRLERELGGRAMGLAQIDNCLCHEGCSRPLGLPCRHPELVRPALEAYGFNVAKTASELLGLELLWCKDGRLPEYLALVGAVCY